MQNENNNTVPAIITTRIFSYTKEKVFSTWSQPELIAQWWGPHGFTNTIHQFPFIKGGEWKLTMHGPDGTDYHNTNLFTEIIPHQKIAFKHIEPIHTFTATAFFEETDEGTKLNFSMVFELLSEYEKLKDFIAAANEENFDRLQTVLTNLK